MNDATPVESPFSVLASSAVKPFLSVTL